MSNEQEHPSNESIDDTFFTHLKEVHSSFKNDENYKKKLLKQIRKNPPPSIIPAVKRIVALGDIHGDYDALLIALSKARVIDTSGNWVGEKTHVVQVGDLLDKGGRGRDVEHHSAVDDSEWRMILFLEKLQGEAREAGGDIHLLLGNHELMNVRNKLGYTSDKTNKYFGGVEERSRLFSRGNFMAVTLARLFNCVVKVGDWIFSHAGILAEKIECYGSDIERLNKDVREYLINPSYLNDNIYDLIEDNDSILWTRIYGRRTDTEICETVRHTLNIINGDKYKGGLIIGHTIQDDGIESLCNNQLHRIDVGMSRAFGEKEEPHDRIEVLEIVDNHQISRIV